MRSVHGDNWKVNMMLTAENNEPLSKHPRTFFHLFVSSSPPYPISSSTMIVRQLFRPKEPMQQTRNKHIITTHLSSSLIGSELIPNSGIVPWSKKCAELNTVPSPPTAIIKSTSAKCCLSNSTRFTHENATLFALRMDTRFSTHSLCEWYLDSRRFHRSALGASPRSLSCDLCVQVVSIVARGRPKSLVLD